MSIQLHMNLYIYIYIYSWHNSFLYKMLCNDRTQIYDGNYYYTLLEFFTSVITDGFTLEFE